MRTIHNTARVITAGPYMKTLTPAELGITGPCSPECEQCARVTEWASEQDQVNYSAERAVRLASRVSPGYNHDAVPSILTKGNTMADPKPDPKPVDEPTTNAGGGQIPPKKPPGN